MRRVQLVSESFDEYLNSKKEALNEGSMVYLQKFLKDPEVNQDSFLLAFEDQFKQKGGDLLKKSVSKIDLDSKKKLAQQALDALEGSKTGSAWIEVKDGKIKGAKALGIQKRGKEI